jgi:hypothetical protein
VHRSTIGLLPGRERTQPYAISGLMRHSRLTVSADRKQLPSGTRRTPFHKGKRKRRRGPVFIGPLSRRIGNPIAATAQRYDNHKRSTRRPPMWPWPPSGERRNLRSCLDERRGRQRGRSK